MDIDYFSLRYADSFLLKGQNRVVPLKRITIGSHVQYEVLPQAPDLSVGKTSYWTDPSGTTTETTYLGMVSVTVTNIPQLPWK